MDKVTQDKLIHQLFIGKVVGEIGSEKTLELLREARKAMEDVGVDPLIHRKVRKRAEERLKKELDDSRKG